MGFVFCTLALAKKNSGLIADLFGSVKALVVLLTVHMVLSHSAHIVVFLLPHVLSGF